MFTDAYMLPVDKCIGHKHTKWQPAQLYHFSLSGSVIKALLSRVTRELCACLARKRYTRRSNPALDPWSTEIRGSVPPSRRGTARRSPAHPRRLRPARGPAIAAAPAAADVAPERAARRSLPAPRTTSRGAPLQTPRPVRSQAAGSGTQPLQPGKTPHRGTRR